jgi:hypothetical protein
MKTNFFISATYDELGSVIKILKKARKDAKKLSKANEDQKVRVTVKTDDIGELEVKEIKYSKELKFI